MSESTLNLEVAGRTYEVPQPPARVGLALQASWTVAHARRAKKDPPAYAVERMARYDNNETEIDEDSLGPVWGQMVADDVNIRDLRRAALAAYAWICTGSEDAAQKILHPERDGGGKGPKASTTTDADDTTPPPDSTSGTTPHQEKSSD